MKIYMFTYCVESMWKQAVNLIAEAGKLKHEIIWPQEGLLADIRQHKPDMVIVGTCCKDCANLPMEEVCTLVSEVLYTSSGGDGRVNVESYTHRNGGGERTALHIPAGANLQPVVDFLLQEEPSADYNVLRGIL